MKTSGDSPAVLEVHGASKSYGRTRALSGFDLTVHTSEFVVLLGPNGAGKTTLFQLLSGLFAPDEGEISIAGIDLRRRTVEALAVMGIVFQQPALDLDLTVRENLMFHARLHGGGRQSASRVSEALDRMSLTERAKDRARTLSGGNRRKVELARALVHRPRLLLMDEATSGLDPSSRQQLLQHVRALCRERGVGVLWATHLVDEAEDGDRVVVLNRGLKTHEGTPAAILSEGEQSLTDTLVALSDQNATSAM